MSDLTRESRLQRGVLVEFDFAVMPGHEIMLDVCRQELAKVGLKIDEVVMARSMFGRSFVAALSATCRAQGVAAAEVSDLAATCNRIFAERITAKIGGIPAGFKDFVGANAARGLKTVLFSRADEESLKAAFSALPEDKLSVSEDITSSFCFTSFEGWRRFARKNGLHERLCVAIAGSGLSVKGALTTGIGSILRDNALAAYQDSSGCDKQIESFDAALLADVLRLLHLS
jgi:hypothetical protein